MDVGIVCEGELNGVLEDNSFNVIVQITESGRDGYTPIKGMRSLMALMLMLLILMW